ncbi:MAG: YihY/virulence factor BrkB family protein [Bacteroidales bacterium]|nr:YihY/virulence factor BrkB family protein [Bacteroidales bacterium]MBN2817473.1 YihY/virulence factor BrkB family protein [Bacteroidales bacterium]
MTEKKTEHNYRFLNNEIVRLVEKLKSVSIPGFDKVPIYDVFMFFFEGLRKGSLNMRATAIAFNFMLALGPALIFFLALLPYLPLGNIQGLLGDFLNGIIPANSYLAIEPVINEIFTRRSGVPIFGLLASLFFAQKGIHGIIEAFNATHHTLESRSWYRQRLVSVILVFIFLGIAAISSMFFLFSKDLVASISIASNITINPFVYSSGKWVFIVLLTFFIISFLYYLGPSRRVGWKFFSAGSTLATFLTIIASLGFSYFMDHFAQLNKFFGSIGALVALMLWMNFNAISLLIGFELNASINNAHIKTNDEY